MKKAISVSSLGCLLMLLSLQVKASTLQLKVSGMYCNYCAATTVQVLKRLPGVSSVKIWLKSGMIIVGGSPSIGSVKNVINRSTFRLNGAYKCPEPTTNLKLCKNI